ncbi:trypsin-like serine protease [Allobranchiibius sp. GilTou73]|uniref:trypsin-like serine protease n=1 Tax=Allobranchiibius sp. GilTou73 TaxID=2904523 RepID=UPI00351D8AD3
MSNARTAFRTVSGLAATLALAAVAAGPAHASTPAAHAQPHIIGGTQASSPYIAQLVFQQGSGTYGCTGEAISADWVLTAQHCIDGTSSMNVYFSNDTSNPGPAIAADGFEASPDGDVALVHLSRSASIGSYAPLANSYSPPPATRAPSTATACAPAADSRTTSTRPTSTCSAPAPTPTGDGPCTCRVRTARPTTATPAAPSSSAAWSSGCARPVTPPTRARTSTRRPTTRT